MFAALVQLLSESPTLWSLSLAAVIALSGNIAWVLTSRYRHRASIIAAETLQKIALREQNRLDRAVEAEVQFLSQLTRHMKAELDGRLSAVSGAQPVAAQVEKKAA
jgi:hypothetical protein